MLPTKSTDTLSVAHPKSGKIDRHTVDVLAAKKERLESIIW